MNGQRDDEPIGSLIGRLVNDSRDYARAEVEIYRQKALAWVPPVRTAAILVVVALFLAQAAFTALLVGLGFWLARWIGPLGGGAAAAAIGLVVAGLLARSAVARLSTTPPGARS